MPTTQEPERWLEGERFVDTLESVRSLHQATGPSELEHVRIWRALETRLMPPTATLRTGWTRLSWLRAFMGFGLFASIALWMSRTPLPAATPRPAAVSIPKTAAPARVESAAQSSESATQAQPAPSSETLQPVLVLHIARSRLTHSPPKIVGSAVRGLSGRGATLVTPNAVLAPQDLNGELDLLSRARRVVASDPARALELTAEHGRRFPDGVLSQEREVLAIDALRQLGKRDQASARTRRFQLQHPDSAHRLRLLLNSEVP